MSVFGEASIAAMRPEHHGLSDEACARMLAAAEGAVDREALIEQYEAILREHGVKVSARTIVYGDAQARYRANIASALVAALFPTEGEAS